MIASFNVNRLVNKSVEVLEHLTDEGVDICLMQETFLKEADTAKLQEIEDSGWAILSDPRKHRSGGGIAVVYDKSYLNLKSNSRVKKYKSYQLMEALLETSQGSIRLVNVYRPPYTKKAKYTESHFLEEFGDYLSDLSSKPGIPVIVGDFNIHMERPTDLYPAKFLSLLNSFGLVQCVPHVQTHNHGGTLDLVITPADYEDMISPITVVESGTRSDHFLVKTELSVDPGVSGCEDKVISYRDFSRIILDDFKWDIRNSDLCRPDTWSALSPEDTFEIYNRVLLELMDKHCPVTNKTIKGNRKSKPWVDDELRTLRTQRRAAERSWRKGKGQRDVFVNLRNKFTVLERQKRVSYNRNFLMVSAGDTKALFKKVYGLTGETTQERPYGKDTEKLAESFRNFFSDKVNTIRSSIEDEGLEIVKTALAKEHTYSGPYLSQFQCISSEHLVGMISKMSNKFCCLDPIPTFLLKECSLDLAPIILHIVNSSMTLGIFPDDMKKAVVKPTIKKKTADPDILKNYRPVSNLSVISKLTEKIVLEQLNDHLQANSLHCPVQSGYRPNHSCETLMIRMTDDVLKEMQNDNIVILVLLDLSAAFDTIDHSILLGKLSDEFGVTNMAHAWFRSYLTDRFYRVKLDSSFSDFVCLLFGVPQGSLLGPILFILYIKKLQEIARKYGLDVHFYADDSQLYISFHPMRPTELHDITERINCCLSEIKAWMVSNFMKINEDKTELLILGKPAVLKKFDLEVSLMFGKHRIDPTECKGDNWKSLGVLLDENLNLERQINNVRKNCAWTMTNLRTIGRYLDERVKLMLVKQLIISKLDYCNALYMNLSKSRIKKLRSVLNGGVRFIYNITDRNVDLTPYYKRAHILPIDQRILFKVCLTCFKIVHGLAPMYLQELAPMEHSDASSKSTRSRPIGEHLMKIPKFSRLKASGRRFSNYAPETWNSLPAKLRSLDQLVIFKSQLKHYLFEQF